MSWINKEPYDIPDKLSAVRDYVRLAMAEKHIIDAEGNILNVENYSKFIDLEIDKRLTELNKNSNNGVIIDREKASVVFGELEYLNNIKTHRTNLNYLVENPIQPTVTPEFKSPKIGLFNGISQFRRVLFNRLKRDNNIVK